MAHRDGIPDPMTTEAQMEKLHQFFAAYFHEDWSLEADSPDQVLLAFVRQQGARELKELSSGIVAFVREHPNEDELDGALFRDLGCYYNPKADGTSARSWLLDVAAKLTPQTDP